MQLDDSQKCHMDPFVPSPLSPIAASEDRLDALDCSNISKNTDVSDHSDEAENSFGNTRGSSLYISTCQHDVAMSSHDEATLWFHEPDISAEEEASFLNEVRNIYEASQIVLPS